MSEQENAQQLLREGIEAAREGDRITARSKFLKVVDLDSDSEKGWFWLASVAQTDDEKHRALTNVLRINPANERAQQALAKLEVVMKDELGEDEVVPGVNRMLFRRLLLGGIAVIALIIIVFAVIVVINGQQAAAASAAATGTARAATQVAVAAATGTSSFQQTQAALATPTLDRPTLPPEFTPTPQLTDTPSGSAATTLPTPPPGVLQGTLVGWSGSEAGRPTFRDAVVFSLTDPGLTTVIQTEGARNVTIFPDGQRIAYTRYFQVTFDWGIEINNLTGAQPQQIGDIAQVFKGEVPTVCASDTRSQMAFAAIPQNRAIDLTQQNVPTAIFLYDLVTGTLTEMTTDDAVYTSPAISPDCARIVAVRDDVRGNQPGADLVIIDAASRQQTPLTTDLGQYVETMPRWSGDGSQVIYAAYASSEPGLNDIFIRFADGSGVPLLPVRDPVADDVNPVFSLDSKYFAFSSNRNGFYDIYIFGINENTLWQLTNSETEDFPGGWWQPQ